MSGLSEQEALYEVVCPDPMHHTIHDGHGQCDERVNALAHLIAAREVEAGRQALRDAADEVGTTSVRLWLRARANGLGGKEGES